MQELFFSIVVEKNSAAPFNKIQGGQRRNKHGRLRRTLQIINKNPLLFPLAEITTAHL